MEIVTTVPIRAEVDGCPATADHLRHLALVDYGDFTAMQVRDGRNCRRLANGHGFDEALLTGPGGVISEGAITNLACYDGTTLVWADAPRIYVPCVLPW